MSTNDPVQRQLIQEAMQAIAQRKPGRSKLVYDKAKRTIVAVSVGSQPAHALNITADDADMFSMITISSDWLRENWKQLQSQSVLSINFSCWDDGDALTQSELWGSAQSNNNARYFTVGSGSSEDLHGVDDRARIVASSSASQNLFSSPDGRHVSRRGERP